MKRAGRVIVRVAVLRASTTTSTAKGASIITDRLEESFSSAFTLGADFGGFGTVGVAFFALGVVGFGYACYAFLAAVASSFTSFSLSTFAFFSAFSFAFFSFSSLFLRVFVAL